MANGIIRFGKQSGGQLALVIPDGVANTEVIVPESGILATKQYVDDNTLLSPNDSRVKTALNASGTAPIYACRAWVNFNGTGTVAIRAGGNVSSITDNGVGNYAVNFTTAMADVNYSAASFGKRGDGTPMPDSTIGGYTISTTQLAVYTANGNGAYTDFSDVHIHIVR